MASAIYKGPKPLVAIVAGCKVLLAMSGEPHRRTALDLQWAALPALAILEDELPKIAQPSSPAAEEVDGEA